MHVLSGAREMFFRVNVRAALYGKKLRNCITSLRARAHTHTHRHTCVYTYTATSGAADYQGHVCLYSLTSITTLRH